MKTNTKVKILAYIKQNKAVTAKDIVLFSKISPQAVFRHLKKLLEMGQIVKVGTPPRVAYYSRLPTDVLYYPYMHVLNWAVAKNPAEPPAEWYCPSSDVWQGRFSRLAPSLLKKNIDPGAAALVSGAIGEIGDNCFAHNAPNWIDIRGCWFEFLIENNTLHCVVADRGRGILASLQRVRPDLQSDQAALLTALTERVTGRAPEQRGNGLKFAMGVLGNLTNGSFILQSGAARFACDLPLDPTKIKKLIVASQSPIRGTYAEFSIQLPYAR